jgi:hypothetical protein
MTLDCMPGEGGDCKNGAFGGKSLRRISDIIRNEQTKGEKEQIRRRGRIFGRLSILGFVQKIWLGSGRWTVLGNVAASRQGRFDSGLIDGRMERAGKDWSNELILLGEGRNGGVEKMRI